MPGDGCRGGNAPVAEARQERLSAAGLNIRL